MDIIGILQGRGLVSTITIEPYLGDGGAGALYGPAVEVPAYVEWKRRKVRNALGKEVTSTGTAYGRLGITAPPESRITTDRGTAYVIGETVHDGAGLPVPSHVELHLT